MSNEDLVMFADRVLSEREAFKVLLSSSYGNDYTSALRGYGGLSSRSVFDAFFDEEWVGGFVGSSFCFADFSDVEWRAYFILAQYCNVRVDVQMRALRVLEEYLGERHEYAIHLRHRVLLALHGLQTFMVNVDPFDDVGYKQRVDSFFR
jgi:hypothetical protein